MSDGVLGKTVDLAVKILIDPETAERIARQGGKPDTPEALKTAFLGHFRRFTLYNPVGLAAGVVFFANAFRPWWYSGVYQNIYSILAYPFVLRHDLPPEGLSYVIDTPAAGVVALLVLLAGYLFLAFWGSTMAGRKGRIFLFATGVFMLLYTAGFYGSLLFATHRVGLPVVGQSVIRYTVDVDIFMYFTKAYYIAIGAGAACLVSPLLHGLVSIPFRRRKKHVPRS